MFYNDASILGVPWETIIKSYRCQLGNKSFSTLEEYGNNFFSYLNGNSKIFPRSTQKQYFLKQFSQQVSEYKSEARRLYVQQRIAGVDALDESAYFAKVIEKEYDSWKELKDLSTSPEHTPESIHAEVDDLILDQIESIAGAMPVDENTKKNLLEIAVMLIKKDYFGDDYTGIVFAGFGEDEHFPVLQHFQVGGMLLDRLKRSEPTVEKVSDSHPSVVTPFAQSEMVDTFLEGINPQFSQDLVRNFIGLALELPNTVIDAISDLSDEQKIRWKSEVENNAKDAISILLDQLQDYRFQRHWLPVHSALVHLPKDELAHVAEALVNLNSFQKKVSMDDETVGGPIDVAVISKGDGLIWIKRKHYFSRELNEHYFNNLVITQGAK